MEERIIDDEYGRGIRLKKTKDGYVDATDELAEEQKSADKTRAADGADAGDVGKAETDESAAESPENTESTEAELPEELERELAEELGEENEAEEVTFEFPDLEKDDEELVDLTPEEAIELRRRKEEEEKARKEEYARLCAEGESLLLSGSYNAAEANFEKALPLAEDATDAAVGYWRAKTADFTRPEALAEEYAESGFLSLENDLGDSAVETIKARFKERFAAKIAQLEEKEKPLAERVEEKRKKRREILCARISAARKRSVFAGVPMVVGIVLAVVFGILTPTRSDGMFLGIAVAAGVVGVICFAFFAVFFNKFLNAMRLKKANEELSSTEEGEELLRIRSHKELYAHFAE